MNENRELLEGRQVARHCSNHLSHRVDQLEVNVQRRRIRVGDSNSSLVASGRIHEDGLLPQRNRRRNTGLAEHSAVCIVLCEHGCSENGSIRGDSCKSGHEWSVDHRFVLARFSGTQLERNSVSPANRSRYVIDKRHVERATIDVCEGNRAAGERCGRVTDENSRLPGKGASESRRDVREIVGVLLSRRDGATGCDQK